MRKQGSGWKGESRRHSLARKGVKTVLPDGRRFDVSKFVSGGEFKDFIKSNPFALYDHPEMEEITIDILTAILLDDWDRVEDLQRLNRKHGADDTASREQIWLYFNKINGYNPDVWATEPKQEWLDKLPMPDSISLEDLVYKLKASGVSIHTTIKEWNNGKIPQNINDWKEILKKTNDELASGYWAYDPSRVEELRQIKFHAQNTIEKKENRIERYRYLRDKQRKGELNYEMADELEVLEIESEFW